MRRPDLIILVAIWEFIMAFFCLIGLSAIMLFAIPAVTMNNLGPGAREGMIGGLFGLSIAIIILLAYFGVAVLGGIGVLTGKEWGRILSLVQAALSLFSLPFGTIAGALILVYLTRHEVMDYFQQRPIVVVRPPDVPTASPTPPVRPST